MGDANEPPRPRTATGKVASDAEIQALADEAERGYSVDPNARDRRPATTANNRKLYDVAREVTDAELGEGAYAELNAGNPDPGTQAAISRWKDGGSRWQATVNSSWSVEVIAGDAAEACSIAGGLYREAMDPGASVDRVEAHRYRTPKRRPGVRREIGDL